MQKAGEHGWPRGWRIGLLIELRDFDGGQSYPRPGGISKTGDTWRIGPDSKWLDAKLERGVDFWGSQLFSSIELLKT